MSRALTNIFNHDLKTNAYLNDPMHTYCDFSVVNATDAPIPLRFRDAKSSSIIENCGECYVTVDRFTVSTSLVPIFVPLIQLGQSDPNLTRYSVTLQYKTFEFQQYVTWVPQYLNQTVNPPLTQQDMRNQYYHSNSFSHVITCFNKALTDAFTGLVALSSELASVTAPYIIFDPTGKEMIISASEAYDIKTAEDPVYIYVNSPLHTLLNGFRWDSFSFGGSSAGKDYRLVIYNDYNFNKIVDADDNVTIQAYEETSSVVNFNPVASISVTCDLPIHESIVNDPFSYGTNSRLTFNSTNLRSSQLTDFTVALDDNTISYFPRVDLVSTNRYRLIDMFGHNNIQQINIACHWTDLYGNQYPVLLAPYESSTMKLLFRKKIFNEK